MTDAQKPIEIFCSYAHEDEIWLQKLKKHLSPLQRQQLLSVWHDRQITPGTDWAREIDTHLNSASIILLLISPDFFASDYCYGVEMKRALERHNANEARVIPILLRSVVHWESAPFARLQVLPAKARPIANWRKKDDAFTDVARGVSKALEKLGALTVSSSRSPFPPIWNIPYPRNVLFTGRADLLMRLETALWSGQATVLSHPQAISGLGGIGKTQIVIEYAYRHTADYEVVLWAGAESRETLTTSFVNIAELLQLPQQDAQDQTITVQAVKTWLQTHTNWLLIMDNADNLAQARAFFPTAMSGHLILTTRAQAVGRLARSIEVDMLTPDIGALFLLRRAGLLPADALFDQAFSHEQALAKEISQELDGLPLALDQAGAYIEETGCSLSDYQRLYRTHRPALLQRRGGLVEDHPRPVATTWSLSFEQVERTNPAAAALLQLCAFLSPDAIPENMITKGAMLLGKPLDQVASDPFLFDQAVEVLRAYSLIRRDPASHMLSMHRLVQAVLRDTLNRDLFAQWVERVGRLINDVFPSRPEFEQWSDCERYLPHVLTYTSLMRDDEVTVPEVAEVLRRAGWYLGERGQYREAERLLKRALAIQERLSGRKDLITARATLALGWLYTQQGKYVEAEPLYQHTLQVFEQQLGPTHPDTAISLNNLAGLYVHQGKYVEAEPLYQRSLSIREQQLGPTHPGTASSLNDLAILYERQGKYVEAEPLYQRSLSIREQQLGPTHPDTAISLNNLAILYERLGKYAEAEPLYRRALSIREQQLDPEHPDTASSLNNLAGLYMRQGKYVEAEPLYQRLLSIREQQLGSTHPDTAIARKNHAYLLGIIRRGDPA